MYYGVVSAPVGTDAEITIGDAVVEDFGTLGLPTVVGEYSMMCLKYKTMIEDLLKVDGTTYANGVMTMAPAAGSLSYNLYCDGAATLAATTAAVAVATISLY